MAGLEDMQGPLADLAFAALDEAVDRVRLDGRPFIPFVMIEQADGDRTTERFSGGGRHDNIDDARCRLADCGPEAERCALAYDGVITTGGDRASAVFIEAHESGTDAAILVAQRFRHGGRLVAFRTIGDPTFAGSVGPLLTSASAAL